MQRRSLRALFLIASLATLPIPFAYAEEASDTRYRLFVGDHADGVARALDPAKASRAFILPEDGQLHRLDVLSGEIEASARVIAPYSMDGHWRDPRPRLAMASDHVAITDPNEGVVRLVSADTLTEERAIPVEGRPYTIVAFGGSGAVH